MHLVALILADPVTHYWDCCMPNCGRDQGQGADRIAVSTMCNVDGSKAGKGGINGTSACDKGGQSGIIMCPDQQPFYEQTQKRWMGFVAAQDLGNLGDCCDCFDLTFSGAQKMTVQVTNHGRINGLFDMLVPGGGFGDFDGCSRIFPKASSVPQDRYGGLHCPSDCDIAFSGHAADGAACHWMFGIASPFPYPAQGVQYPGDAEVTNSQKVACPAALNSRSGCWGGQPSPAPTPTPPSPPGPGPSPGCPGGNLAKCIAQCPTHPPHKYKHCVEKCAEDCPSGPPPPTPGCPNQMYAQCGGKTFSGNHCCPTGASLHAAAVASTRG